MEPSIETLNELAAAWSNSILRATWQGAVAIAAAWALVRCRPALPARVACWVWRLADVKLIVALLWSTPLLLPLLPLPAEPQPPRATIVAHDLPPSRAEAPQRITSLAREPAPTLVSQRLSPACVLLALWLAGVVGVLTFVGRAGLSVIRLRRSCIPINCPELRAAATDLALILGLRRVPELKSGPAVSRPLLVGAFRPAILLPRDMACDPRSNAVVRPVLAHELAHVRRRDLLWSTPAGLVRAAFFFHPLVWLAHREALLAREAACDALALRASGVKPSEYGRILLMIAARGSDRASRWLAPLGMAGSTSTLKRRLMTMKTNQQPSRRRLISWALTLLVLGAVGVVPWQLVSSQALAQNLPTVQTAPSKQPVRAKELTRVLYLGARATPWDMRYLASALAPVSDIQLEQQILRVAGTLDDAEFGAGRYNVYVIGDFPADFLTKRQQEKLVEVVETGAGLISLGGSSSYASGGWGGSALTRIMPVQVGNQPDWIEPGAGVRVIPQSGKLSASLLELAPNPEQSTRLWGELPPLLGLNRLGSLKPSALLLARTDGGLPFLVGQEVGKGRVLAIAGETWIWARQSGATRAAHRLFWERTIRWAGHRDKADLALEGQAPKEPEKEAQPRRVIIQLIRQTDKQPVPGATVVIASCRYPNGFWGAPPDGEPERITDRQGRCLIDVPRDVSGLSIFSVNDGYAPASQSVCWEGETGFLYLTGQDWTRQELRKGSAPIVKRELERGETIGGLVTGEQGRPVQGADVVVAFDHHSDKPDADFLTPSIWSASGDFAFVRVKTDAAGRWRCSSLPAKPRLNSVLLLRVVHPDHVSDTGGFKRQLSLRTARAMTGVVVMKSGASVSGRVRDNDGKPIPGARVVLAYSNDPADSLSTRTDAAGRFVFAHADDLAPLQRWIVEIEAAGFAPKSTVTAPRADPPPLDLTLTRGRPFHGRVIDRQGHPIANIDVRPRWDFFDHLAWRAVTGADGRFVWPDAPPEGDFALELHKGGIPDPIAQVSGKTDRADLTFDPD